MKRMIAAFTASLAGLGMAQNVSAQDLSNIPTDRFYFSAEAAYVYQGAAGLSGGGSFTADRFFARLGTLRAFDNGAAVGLTFGYGASNYNFGTGVVAPWSSVNDLRVSGVFTFEGDRGPRWIVVPSLRFDYESGANSGDGFTYGVFAGASWQVQSHFSIGPAIGVFSDLVDGGVDVFPALLIDWRITDAWRISTGSGLGASQGPGLNIDYTFNEKFTVGLAGRYENNKFRLNNTGVAPGGTGADRSFPLVATFEYKPYPAGSISVFAGVELGGELSTYNAAGTLVRRQTYDAAPILGASFRFFF